MLKKHFLKQSQQSGSMNLAPTKNQAPTQTQLEELGHYLQDSLQQRSPWLRLKVQCAVKESTLLVLIEHLLHIEPDADLTFFDLEDALIKRSEELLRSGFTRSVVGNSQSLPVRAYLRISGYQQPYATDTFPVEPQPPETETSETSTASTESVQFASVETSAPAPEPEISEPLTAELIAAELIAASLIAEPEPEAIASEHPAVEEAIESPELEPIVAEPAPPEPEIVDPAAQSSAEESFSGVSPWEIASPWDAAEPAIETSSIASNRSEVAPEAIAEPKILPEAIAEPAIAEPEILLEAIAEPAIAEPEILLEAIAEPAVAEPEILLEAIAEPAIAEPEILLEAIAELAVAEILPEAIAEPAVAEPEILPEAIAEPEILPEAIAEPVVAEPEILPEAIVEPEILPEAIVEPEILPEAIAEPEIAEPEVTPEAIVEPSSAEAYVAPEPEIPPTQPVPLGLTLLEIESALSELETFPVEHSRTAFSSAAAAPPIAEPESEAIAETPVVEPIVEPVVEPIVEQPDRRIEPASIESDGIQPDETEPPIATVSSSAESESSAIEESLTPEPTQLNLPDSALENPFLQLGETELGQTESEPPAPVVGIDQPLIKLPDSYSVEPTASPVNQAGSATISPSALDLPSQIEPPVEAASIAEPPVEEPPIAETPTTIVRAPETLPTSQELSSMPRERKVIVVDPPAPPQPRSRWSASGVMLTGSVGLFALVSAAYALTRPCVLGSTCEPLEKAQQLDQQASQTIASTDSALKVAEVYNQLDQARRLLGTIPEWSSQHQTAQALQATYSAKADVVGQLLRALKQANLAAQQSQNPPHPLQDWRKIQLTWREAIAMLEKVPESSPVAALAHKKLQDYQANLSQTDARVLTEQDAQDKITNARNTAQVAETKAGLASSPESWQQVYLTWEAAIALMKQVPEGTMAQVEAQKLLPGYQTKMADASQRRLQEAASTGSLQDAINSAEQARSLEQKNQWQQAIEIWQQALGTVQKVPQDTSYYLQAQALVGEYQTALMQAKESQRRLAAMQTIKPDLDRVCNSALRVCTYTFSPEAVRVQVTAQYDQVVESHINNSQLRGNFSARTEVVNQVNQLLQGLSGISETARVPIELYNSNGSKFGTYTPNPSGGASTISGAQ